MTQLYTPFMAQAGEKIGQAMLQKAQNKLIGQAYMGQPGAMENLAQYNPQAAIALQRQRQQEEQLKLQQAVKKQESQRKIWKENKSLTDEVIQNTAQFDNYEQAKSYFDEQKELYRPLFTTPETGDMLAGVELTPQSFEQIRHLYGPKQEKLGALDRAKLEKIRAETAKIGRESRVGPDIGGNIDILTQNLSPEVAAKAKAAFELSGGGEKGVKKLMETIDQAGEIEKHSMAKGYIERLYPDVSNKQKDQLLAAVESSKTAQEGLEFAAKVREQQETLDKQKQFKNDAIFLLERIVKNEEIDDVLGTVEQYNFPRFSANERRAIADIRGASEILTVENMDLMTGVLSESDLKVLRTVSSYALDRSRSPEDFLADVNRLIKILKKAKHLDKDEVPEIEGIQKRKLDPNKEYSTQELIEYYK